MDHREKEHCHEVFRREMKAWLLCLLVVAPFMVYYVCHAFLSHRPGLIAAGFLTYDHMIHMANAREYFDGGFHLTYGNPASPFYDTPRIYFQPSTLLLGLLWKLSGLEPGPAAAIFGFFSALLCARGALELYREFVGFESAAHRTGFLLFFWGAGIMALTGSLWCFLTGTPLTHRSLFMFDPHDGEWCLTFGRNFISPLESCYHALFVWTMVFVLRKRFALAAVLAALTALCHPFTGTELLAILLLWSLFEYFFMRSKEVPASFIAVLTAICTVHFGYYMIFLPLVREHAVLAASWSQHYWVMDGRNFVPAYLFVALLTAASFRNVECARREFSLPSRRLAFLWFCTAFLLASNHILLSPPVQPLHFTRGYIWASLFLLGSSALVALLGRLFALRRPMVRFIAVAALLLIFCADNILWLSHKDTSERTAWLSHDEKEVLTWMNGKEASGREILSVDLPLNYHAILYTPLRAWCSHIFNTPEYDRRSREMADLFLSGVFLPRWKQMPLLVVFNTRMTGHSIPSWVAHYRGTLVFSNGTYQVYALDPEDG